MIRYAFMLAAVAAAAGVLVATSAAGQPPPAGPHIGMNRGEPRAGHSFTAFIVTPTTGGVQSVHCDGTLRGKTLYSHTRRFFSSDAGGLVAVSCGWKVPAGARGVISAGIRIETAFGETSMGDPVPFHWRIRR
jgi:hypothetical protein